MSSEKTHEWLEGYKAGLADAAQIAVNQLTADTTVNNAQTCRAIKDKIEEAMKNEPAHPR